MNLNRRNFLFGSAAATALAGCTTDKIGTRTLKPGEKANVALIGFGIQQRSALMPQCCTLLADLRKITRLVPSPPILRTTT